jgi:hypothetical protein
MIVTRRRAVVALVLAAAGAVVFIEARGPRAVRADLGRDELGEAPPYPFPERTPSALEARLGQQKVNLNLQDTPFTEAIEVLHDLTNVPFQVDERLAPRAAESKVSIRVRDTTLLSALRRIVATLGVPVTPSLEGNKVRLYRSCDLPPQPLCERVSARALLQRNRGEVWRDDYEKRLTYQKITFRFEETTLSEIAGFFADFTGMNVMLAREIDADALKVTLTVHDKVAREALDETLAPLGLHWVLRDECLVIVPPLAPDSLGARRVTLDLRGVKTPDLVAALEKASVPVIASPESWRGRGTFSVCVADVPLADAVAAIESSSGLHATLLEEPEAVVVLDGAVPSVRSALELVAPVECKGVKKQLAALREELATRVAERNTLRASGAKGPLLAAERRTHETVHLMTAIVGRASAITDAPARRDRAQAAITSAKTRWAKNEAKYDLRVAEQDLEARTRLLAGATLVERDGDLEVVEPGVKK